MNTLDAILKLDPNQFETSWPQIDKIIGGLPSNKEQADGMEKYPRPNGLGAELYFAQNRFVAGHTGEYPLARAIVGLLAGVLEAILADRLPNVGSKTLGGLITEANKSVVIQVGTKLAALSSLMLRLIPSEGSNR